nr:response regulator [Methylopila capsulata]
MTVVSPLILPHVPASRDAESAADGSVETELRRKLAESEARFAALAEAMPHMVWSTDAEGVADYYNSCWHDYTGMPVHRDGRNVWTDYVHPDDVEPAEDAWRRSLASGEPYSTEYRLRRAGDGAWRWFLARARAVRDAEGEIVRWFGASTDIDDVVRAREELAGRRRELERIAADRAADLVDAERRLEVEIAGRRSIETERAEVDALYAAYIDNTTDGVFVIEAAPDGRVVVETVNRVIERAFAIRRDEVRGLSLRLMLGAAAADRLAANLAECLRTKKPVRYEETVERDGGERVFEVTLAPVTIGPARSTRIVGSARDLTERRRAEQQLRQAQKMEAVGQLTGGIAHDFNNLLQVVKGNLDLLALDLAGPAAALRTPQIERRLRDAMAGAARGAKLTRQLLAFSRRQPLAPKAVAVAELVASMLDLLQRTLGETVIVRIDVAPPHWTALVDPAQLENAVLNLAINARDAMPGGGTLDIAVRNLVDPVDGDRLEIRVADSGTGMDARTLSRVFEPFFSTKPEGKGTGLGLPQVQGFIEQSNGRIEIESLPGAGTTVRLSLPRTHAAPAAAEEAPGIEDMRGRGESILVVEDDDAVRRAVADLLAALGYAVTAAGSTREAAALLERGERFDLLLSDVVMPGQPNPPELAREAQATRPELKVLFMSGYAEDVVVHHGRIDADIHLIQKPYRQDELAVRLRRLLDASAPPPEPRAVRAGPVTVLLVEDDALIAMGVADLLASFGHQVIEARTAADAQAVIREGKPVDLVLADLGLPDMDGDALARWCRDERPNLPVVFATGRADFELGAAFDDGPTQVVTKPFDGLTLRAALDACLA